MHSGQAPETSCSILGRFARKCQTNEATQHSGMAANRRKGRKNRNAQNSQSPMDCVFLREMLLPGKSATVTDTPLQDFRRTAVHKPGIWQIHPPAAGGTSNCSGVSVTAGNFLTGDVHPRKRCRTLVCHRNPTQARSIGWQRSTEVRGQASGFQPSGLVSSVFCL